MRRLLYASMAIFVAGVLLALAQLWLGLWSAEFFLKVEITLGAMLAVVVVIWFVRKESHDYKRQHTAHALDDE
ncbi:MAG: hypothetical protein KGI91_03180 [Burkholderiales bacterium]|nr:hypothetical protein [Burkholderiales bacterium]MDE2076065.1 hypothetical protein [Burkholderiales bacterium]MDE2431445.1 hypothetical protein [Burkholderiales bacterium]